MLLVLPPSEGKTAPAHGAPVDPAALTAPELGPDRRRVMRALTAVSGRRDAVDVLGVGATLADEVARNVGLASAPAAPAADVYTGVLYAAADLPGLDDEQLVRAERSVRVVSALWGVVGPLDRIPAYRLSMGTTLPRLGPLATFWRPRLTRVLDPVAQERVVVDVRSAAYAAAWVPPGGGAGHVTVRVEREVAGRRTVVAHWAKQARGALVGHLVRRAGEQPGSAEDVRDAAHELVGTGPLGRTAPGLMASELLGAELATGPRGSHVLTLVVAELPATR